MGAWVAAGGSRSIDFQAGSSITVECSDRFDMIAQQLFNRFGGLITAPEPDHFWRRAVKKRPFREIYIKRNERETAGGSVVPNGKVVSFRKRQEPYVAGLRNKVGKPLTQFETQVLIEQKGAVAELVGIEGGVVSGVFNLESSGVEASDRRPRHDEHYHEA